MIVCLRHYTYYASTVEISGGTLALIMLNIFMCNQTKGGEIIQVGVNFIAAANRVHGYRITPTLLFVATIFIVLSLYILYIQLPGLQKPPDVIHFTGAKLPAHLSVLYPSVVYENALIFMVMTLCAI